jgi:hypothetical protein
MLKTIRYGRLVFAAGIVALLTACAHPISLEATKLPERDSNSALVAKKVGYVVTDADKGKQVITPGGGGDKVSYFPYRDMEPALRAALRAVYQDVSALKSAQDKAAIKEAGVAYIFTPEVITNSSSTSMLTWPPTQFRAEVMCTVTDPNGAVLAKVRAVGNGAAEFSEFKSDFSLSARRAVAEVAEKLAQEIRNNAALR